MRQVGILAAAGLHALDHHVERLAEDHAKACFLAAGLADFPGLTVSGTPETNIVVFEAEDVPGLWAGARERGVQLSLMDARTLRAVTHMDVTQEDVEAAVEILREVLAGLSG